MSEKNGNRKGLKVELPGAKTETETQNVVKRWNHEKIPDYRTLHLGGMIIRNCMQMQLEGRNEIGGEGGEEEEEKWERGR